MRHRQTARLNLRWGHSGNAFGRSRIRGTLLASTAVVAATALLGANMFRPNVEDEVPTETVVVEVAMTDGEAATLKAARSAAVNIDLVTLRQLDDPAATELLDSLDMIETHLSSTPTQSTFLTFEGVPAEVSRSCRDGEVGAWKPLMTAERLSITRSTSPRLQEPPIVIPRRPTVPASEVERAVDVFEQSLEALPLRTQLQILDPDQLSFDMVTDEEVAAALADSEVPVVRAEANRRLAERLPDLSGAENGKLDPSLLCPIPWVSPDYQVLCVAVPNLVSLNEAFKAEFGHDLHVRSGYRSFEQQQSAHAASPTMTTLPGTSNHSWGLAVDFDIAEYKSYDHPEVAWLVENAPTYGWRNPKHESFQTLKPEPWHYEFGTKYNDDPDWGFLGPIPEDPFLIKLPEGQRTVTLYSN